MEKEEIKEEEEVIETKKEEVLLKDKEEVVKPMQKKWELTISFTQIICSMVLMSVVLWCVIIWKFKYTLYSLIYYIVPGLIFGLLYVYLYKYNVKEKKMTTEQVKYKLKNNKDYVLIS